MKIKKSLIYNIFLNNQGKKESLNDILKGTKSVLSSKSGYQKYIINYSLATKRKTFKKPNITEYPMIRTESSFLIPVKKINNKSSENITKKLKLIKLNPGKNILFSKDILKKNNSDFFENYNKRFYQFLKMKTEPTNLKLVQKNLYEKKFKRYNSLFLDFFDKWNDYSMNNTKNILSNQKKEMSEIFKTRNKIYDNEKNNEINLNYFKVKERYSGLHYEENEIFNINYDKFIENKINDLKVNKIKNFTINLETEFNDLNNKKIHMKLDSMKVIFSSMDVNNSEKNNSFFIYLPLSFVFLFYFKDINFFQKVLLSILHFEKGFKKVFLKDDQLYIFLTQLNSTIKNEENNNENDSDIDYLSNFQTRNYYKCNSNRGLLKKNSMEKKEHEKEMRKTYGKHNIYFMNKLFKRKINEKFESSNESKKKLLIVHSGNNLKYMEDKKNKYINIQKNGDISNKNNIFNNEYYFIWETPKMSYKVKVEMPKIFFSYEDIKYKICNYCGGNLFLYLYRNNFINWDFYTLNYLFSLKNFRKIISHFLSFNNDYSLIKHRISKSYAQNFPNNNTENIYRLFEEKNGKITNKIIFLINKKIYNHIKENNESLNFFYTDSKLENYILNLHSYHIKIEYEKLNPHLNWMFFLNFKQMKYLNEVSKYEQLTFFLPKIIKTNFEYGTLNINFEIFDNNFDAQILKNDYNLLENKTELNESINNNEIIIKINKPFIEIDKVVKDENNFLSKQEFNYIFLQNLNKIKLERWPKKILESLDENSLINNGKISKVNYLKFNYFNGGSDNLKVKFKRSNKQKLTYFNKKINNFEFIKPSKKLNSKEN